MSDVTVIIPAYNAGKYLVECLESVREQTFPDWSCIIYDDGSTDNTLEIAEGFALNDSRFLVVSRANRGTPRVVFDAYAQVDTEYFCQVDADDKISPKAIETLHRVLESCSEDVGVAYSDYLRIDEDGTPDYNDPHFKSRCRQTFSLHRMQTNGFCAFQFRLIRTSAYNLSLPVDSNVPVGEDFDFVMKLSEVCQFIHVPQRLYYYRQHKEQTSRKNTPLLESTCRSIMTESKARSANPDYIILLHYSGIKDIFALRTWASINTANVLMLVVIADPLDVAVKSCKEYSHHRVEVIPESNGEIDYKYLASRMVPNTQVIEFNEMVIPTGDAVDDLIAGMSIPVYSVEPRTTWLLQAGLVRLPLFISDGADVAELIGDGLKSQHYFYRATREDFKQ